LARREDRMEDADYFRHKEEQCRRLAGAIFNQHDPAVAIFSRSQWNSRPKPSHSPPKRQARSKSIRPLPNPNKHARLWLYLRSPRPAVGGRPDWLRRPRSERHPAGSDRPQSSRINRSGRCGSNPPRRVGRRGRSARPFGRVLCCVPEKEQIVNKSLTQVSGTRPGGTACSPHGPL
jgi:hypothetical protein